MLHRKEKLDNKEVLIYLENRKDARVSIGKKVNIRIPVNAENKRELIAKCKAWAKARINEEEKLRPEKTEFKDGDSLTIRGTTYTIRIFSKNTKSSSARINNNQIFIYVSQEAEDQQKHVSTLLSRTLASLYRQEIEKEVKDLNEKYFKAPLNQVRLKNLKSRWGSCAGNNINLSTALLFAPDDVLQYVCIHELAHLIEKNHSKEFWKLVERAMPDYREKIKWLKDNKNLLLRFH